MPDQPLQHDDLSELLSAYLDGEVTAEEQALVERRLGESAEFRQLHDELRSLRSGIQLLPREQPGPDFAEAVLRRAERAMLAASALKPAVPPDAEAVVRGALPTAQERIMRGLRAFRWSLAAIAVALLLMFFNPEEKQKQPQVAMADKKAAREAGTSKGESGDGEMVALPPTEHPAEQSAAPTPALGAALPEADAMNAAEGVAKPAALQADAPMAAPAAPLAARMRADQGTATAKDTGAAQSARDTQSRELGRSIAGGQLHSATRPYFGGSRAKLSTVPENDDQRTVERKSAEAATRTPGMLIVHCDISPKAARERAFEHLLSTQQIDIAVNNEPAKAPAEVQPLEAFMVEAAPEQISATLTELQSRTGDFPAVKIEPAAEGDVTDEQLNLASKQLQKSQTAARRGRAVRIDSSALPAHEKSSDGILEEADRSSARPEVQTRESRSVSEAQDTQRVLFLLRVVPQDAPSR